MKQEKHTGWLSTVYYVEKGKKSKKKSCTE